MCVGWFVFARTRCRVSATCRVCVCARAGLHANVCVRALAFTLLPFTRFLRATALIHRFYPGTAHYCRHYGKRPRRVFEDGKGTLRKFAETRRESDTSAYPGNTSVDSSVLCLKPKEKEECVFFFHTSDSISEDLRNDYVCRITRYWHSSISKFNFSVF